MKYCPARLQKRKAQTLIEAVLSIGLAAMVLSALLILGAASSKTVASSLRRSQATKLAVESLEAVRFLRDTSGFPLLREGCYNLTGSTLNRIGACDAASYITVTSTGETGQNNTFERRIEVAPDSGGNLYAKTINVAIRWEDATGETTGGVTYKTVELNTILAKW